MPLLKEEAYTIDDIYALPDGERAELIDGRMYIMACYHLQVSLAINIL